MDNTKVSGWMDREKVMEDRRWKMVMFTKECLKIVKEMVSEYITIRRKI